MNATKTIALTCLALGLTLPATTWSADTVALPKAKTEHGITYLSGGVGEPEAAAMKAAAKNYDLMLTFAAKVKGMSKNEYLADIKVDIRDAKGKTVLDTVSEGPIFLAKLPAGRYTVRAKENGHTVTKHVVVSDKRHAQSVFYWPGALVG